jgi:hypothetical protein
MFRIFSENHAVYEVILKKYVTARQVTVDHSWINKARHTLGARVGAVG